MVPVFVTNAVRTSAGPGPGPKMLPAGEANRLKSAKLAVHGHIAPAGYSDGGADAATVHASKAFRGYPAPRAAQGN